MTANAIPDPAQTAARSRRTLTRRVAFRDTAYKTLRDAIVHGELAPGAQIPEEGLAETLGVSRTPLREAVNRLQAEGLVRRAPNRRLFVTPVSAEEARSVFAVRLALEDLALTEAAAALTSDILEELRLSLERMEKAEKTRREDVAEGGRSFHDILYHAAGNAINEDILRRLQVKVDRYRYIATGGGSRRQRQAVDEHLAVYQALRTGDVESARRALRVHLDGARQAAVRGLESEQGAALLSLPRQARPAPASTSR
jgi:DNA-binding GntR family transcriptional regulator